MSQPRFITIEVDGVRVSGEVTHHTARCVAIRLVEPFSGLTDSVTVPLFAAHLTSYEGQGAEATARALIARAYERGLLFTRHADHLRRMWRWTHSLLLKLAHDDPDAPARIADERRLIRARFRAGAIMARENQRLLAPLHARRRAYDRRRCQIVRQFEESRPWRSDSDVSLREVVEFLGEDDSVLRE